MRVGGWMMMDVQSWIDEDGWVRTDGWMILCVWKMELWDKGFKVSEDRTRAPYLFPSLQLIRAESCPLNPVRCQIRKIS